MMRQTTVQTFLSSVLLTSFCGLLEAQIEFGTPKRITTIDGGVWGPALSPDGSELYFWFFWRISG